MTEPTEGVDPALVARMEDLFDKGYTPDKIIHELQIKGDLSKERRCLELFRDRQKRKDERTKRFAVALPSSTGDADNEVAPSKRARGSTMNRGGHLTWVFERDASVQDRLEEALPVSREKPIAKPEMPQFSEHEGTPHQEGVFHPGQTHFHRGGRGGRGRGQAPPPHWRGGLNRGRGGRGRHHLPFSVGVDWNAQQQEQAAPQNYPNEVVDESQEGSNTGQREVEGSEGLTSGEPPYQPQWNNNAGPYGHPTPQHFYRGRGRGGSHYYPRGQPWRGRGYHYQHRGGHWQGQGQFANQTWTPYAGGNSEEQETQTNDANGTAGVDDQQEQ